MKRHAGGAIPVLVALIALVAIPAAGARQSEEDAASRGARLGVFDSRAVALAHYRSKAFQGHLAELKAELEKAKAGGDRKRVEELEAKGPALQALMHKQAFGTWPVDEILKTIEEELAGIAAGAGVDVIVSRWDVAYRKPGVELVDVTDGMVAPFEPDAATRRVIEDMRGKDPVPAEELEDHED